MFLLLLLALLAYLFFHFRRVSRLPPGPFPLPIIGNIHQIAYQAWRLNGTVPMLNYYRKKHGDVFTLWFGPVPHVSIVDHEAIQEMFVKNGSKYADRFLPPVFLDIAKGLGLIHSNGEHWQEMRKFVLSFLRSMGVGKELMEQKIMEEFSERCKEELDEKAIDGVTVANSSEFFDLTVGSIINNMMVGKRFEGENKADFLKIKALLDEGQDTLTAFDIIAPVWLSKRFTNRHEIIHNVDKSAKDFIAKEALKRIAEVKSGSYVINSDSPEDFVDAYILKMNRDPQTFTLDALRQILHDLWAAGQDTTSKTLVSGFNHLVRKPELIVEIRKELLKVTDNGARSLSLKDRQNTPFLLATLAEIQRHASIINLNLFRYNHEPTTVSGYHVESGALVVAQLSAIHCHEGIFRNPDEFDPWRFIRDEKLLQQVIPFGIGKRACVGENLARAELYLIFGNLLLRYDVRAHGALPKVEDQAPFAAGKCPERNVLLKFVKL